MQSPASAPTFFALATIVSLSITAELRADETRDRLRQAVQRDLPRYDSSIREKALVEQAARAAARAKNAPADLPPEKPVQATTTERVAASDHAVELPTVTVHPTYTPPKHLPRLEAPPAPPGGDLKAEPFETPAGRDARLVKKHVSKLSQALNRFSRFFGVSPVAMAREAEAREQKAHLMNALAEGIEMQELLGRDPAEIRQLRAEYKKLYYSGPKN
jgi:hypothetical protein